MSKVSCLLVCAAILVGPAAAASDEHRAPPVPDAAWQNECASCHTLFPPALLTQDSWHRLMGGLERHFGADASLDAATRDRIDAFLAANAAPDRDSEHASESGRITETEWFYRKHRRKAARLWQDGRVSSPANCTACHKSSDERYW